MSKPERAKPKEITFYTREELALWLTVTIKIPDARENSGTFDVVLDLSTRSDIAERIAMQPGGWRIFGPPNAPKKSTQKRHLAARSRAR